MNQILNNLPITRIKIFIASFLYKLTRIFVRNDIQTISRGGIIYRVDISEGLDLSLFLFGNFQSHVTKNKNLQIPNDAWIFDVGANIGIMSLQFAKMAQNGRVFAFEPTHFATQKLKENLRLNPALQSKVEVIQSFVTSERKLHEEIKAYSSWKVGGAQPDEKHPVHLGSAMSAEGVGSTTLDKFCKQNSIGRVDLIKIDTDGHEPDVFEGGKEIIKKHKPILIFEVGQYVMDEMGIDFNYYLDYLLPIGYKLVNSANNKDITANNWKKLIPSRGTIDVLAFLK